MYKYFQLLKHANVMCIYSGFEFMSSCVLKWCKCCKWLFEFDVCKLVEGIKKNFILILC